MEGEAPRTAGDGREPGSPALGFALTFVQGRAVLGLEGRPLAPLGRVDRLEMEVPNLRFPFDFSGGVARFRNRRCRLRELSLSLSAGEVAAFLRSPRLADFGILDPQVTLVAGELRLDASARVGDREVGFTARARLLPVPPRRARLAFFDVRVYGFLPVPGPMLVAALFATAGALPGTGPSEKIGAAVPVGAPLMWVEGPTDLQLELVEAVLLGLLPEFGWRLPERGRVQATAVEGDDARLTIRYAAEGSADESASSLAGYDESRKRHAAAEAALIRGDVMAAIEDYRRMAPLAAGDSFAVARLLQLLSTGASTLGEAESLAAAALEQWPDFVPALLALAAAASEAGRSQDAAMLYQRLATAAADEGASADRAWALVAAARERGKVAAGRERGEVDATEGTAAATEVLEGAVSGSPGHRGAARALSRALAAEGRWPDLLRLVIQRAVDEPDPGAKAALYAEAGFIYLDRTYDSARAHDRFQQAVRLAPDGPAGWEGLGRIQAEAGRPLLERALALYRERGDRPGQARVSVALAALDEGGGDDQAALARLEEAAALDVEAPEPLRRAGEIEARRQRFAEAGRLLDAALARTRDGDLRARIVRRLADVLGGPLGEPLSARVLLEQALANTPADPGLLDELRALLEREGAQAEWEWEPFVRRAVAEAQSSEDRQAALARLRDLLRGRGDPAALAKVLGRLCAEPGPERVAAVIELAELAKESTAPALAGPAIEALTALLSEAEAPVPTTTRSALAGRLAWLLDRQGDQDGTLAWLRVCLEGDAEGAVAIAAWRRFVEIAARRGDATAAAQALVAWADDLRTGESERSRAAHLVAAAEIFRERLGLASDAVALLERAVSLDPLNNNAFTILETIAASMQDWGRVTEVLERRIEVARSPEQKPLLERLGAVLVESLGRPADAAEVYRRLLDLEPEHPQALLFRARHLWTDEAKDESASHYQRLLEVGQLEPQDLAEAHLRLGQWARVVGNLEVANRHVDQGLAGEPAAGAPVGVLVEVLEAFDRSDDLVVRLVEREAAAAPAWRNEIARARAGVLERVGRAGEATEVYRALLTETPDDVGVLQRLAELCRREGRAADLEPLLERLWDLATRGDPTKAPPDIDAEAVGLELAGLLSGARAEEILRTLLARSPGSPQVLEALGGVLVARGANEEADAILLERVAQSAEPRATARQLADRARQRLSAGPDNEDAAFTLLRRADPAALDPDALALRAQLAEKRDDFSDALSIVRTLRAGARVVGEPARVAALDVWLLRLAARPEVPVEEASALLEEMLAVDSADSATLAPASQALLDRALPLSDATRARMHLMLAEAAEQAGDLARAAIEFERALALEAPPAERARQLVGHARILVARREVDEAMVDVSEALALIPDHAGALALKADVLFRNQEWEEARRYYVQLAAAPGVAEAISAELLAFRRAVLAETFGDDAEAEAAYLEVASLNPAHLESREVLAQISLYRGDLTEAARRLEEVLRLLPLEALDKLRETRQRLGEVYFELEDYVASRHYLELVLAEEPDREGALEALVAVYEHLDLHADAADLCGRLARVYADPELRAQALYRQGEILRARLGDLAAANDAYLRASDLDPSFVPTLLRLCHYYWSEGDFTNLREIGTELLKTRGAEALAHDGVGLMLALGGAASRRDSALARAVLHVSALQPEATAQRLAELVKILGRRSPEALDPALEVLFTVGPTAVGKPLVDALSARVVANPRDVGALVVLGRVAERRSEVAIARAAYSVLWTIDPEFPVGARLAALGPGGPVRPEAWVVGALDHPLVRGPLRRTLRVLAGPLAGFGRISSRNKVAGMSLEASSLAVLEEIRAWLDAPPFRAVLQTEISQASVIGTRPITVALGPRAAELPAAELSFLGAGALEDARSGTFIATALAAPALIELLRAVALFLGGHPGGGGELDRNVAAWLTDQEHAVLLPDDRLQLVVDLEEVLAQTDQLEAQLPDYLRGCHFTANRVGLVACGSPLAALRALSKMEGEGASTALTELVAFLLSPEYRALFT